MEYFYTFLSPIIFEFDSQRYLCWGYQEVDGEVVGFTATLSSEQKWTDSNYFNDKKLVEEFKKYLPEKLIKKKRRKKC